MWQCRVRLQETRVQDAGLMEPTIIWQHQTWLAAAVWPHSSANAHRTSHRRHRAELSRPRGRSTFAHAGRERSTQRRSTQPAGVSCRCGAVQYPRHTSASRRWRGHVGTVSSWAWSARRGEPRGEDVMANAFSAMRSAKPRPLPRPPLPHPSQVHQP
jgi:hypothetical protein